MIFSYVIMNNHLHLFIKRYKDFMRENNLILKNNCYLCGSENNSNKNSIMLPAIFRFLTDFKEYKIRYKVCQKCGLLYLANAPPPKFYDEFYSTVPIEIFSYNHSKEVAKAKKILDFLKLKKIESILDIGCGTGKLLKVFSEDKCNCTGIELSKNACDFIKNCCYNINIINKSILKSLPEIDSKYFDVITMKHVLEHIQNPNIVLQSIFKLNFKKIYIEIPTLAEDTTTKTFFYAYGHFSYYTENTLTALFSKNGYTLERINSNENNIKAVFIKNKTHFNYDKHSEILKMNNLMHIKKKEFINIKKRLNYKILKIRNLLNNQKKIILYGLGSNLCRIIKKIEKNNHNIVAIADKNSIFNKKKFLGQYQIITPEKINKFNYDYIVYTN